MTIFHCIHRSRSAEPSVAPPAPGPRPFSQCSVQCVRVAQLHWPWLVLHVPGSRPLWAVWPETPGPAGQRQSKCCEHETHLLLHESVATPPALSSSLTMFVLSQLLLVCDTLQADLLGLTLCFSGVWDRMAWIRPLLLLCADDPSSECLRNTGLCIRYAVRHHGMMHHWCLDLQAHYQ